MSFLLRAGLCLVVLLTFGTSTDLLHGQQINYSFSGLASFAAAIPEVSPGERYVANFVVDGAALDSDPSATRGEYTNAILFSSVEFSGGYVSQVDFAGGDVVVQQDLGGGGVFLVAPDSNQSTIVIADIGNPLPSDALVTDLAAVIFEDPFASLSLFEPGGNVAGPAFGDDVFVGPTAVPEPSTACFLGFGVLLCAIRRRR